VRSIDTHSGSAPALEGLEAPAPDSGSISKLMLPDQASPGGETWFGITWQRRLFVAALAALSLGTLLIVRLHGLRLIFYRPGVRLQLETVGAVVAITTAILALMWFSFTGSRSTMLLSIAFMLIGASRIVFGMPGTRFGLMPQQELYFSTLSGLAAGGLMVYAAWSSRRREPPLRRPVSTFIIVTGCVFGALSAAEWLLWTQRAHLPALSLAGPGAVLHARGLLPHLTLAAPVIGGLGALVYVVAAWLFVGRRPSERPRGIWLPVALLFAAFSRLHYLLYPSRPPDWVSTGDILLTAFLATLAAGLLWEVYTSLRSEQRQRRELTELQSIRSQIGRVLAHDIVSSVAAVRNFSVYLRANWEQLPEPERRRTSERLDRQSARLRDLVEESLTALDANAELLSLSPRPCRASDLVSQAIEDHYDPDGRLRVDVDASAREAWLKADPARIGQVFENLFSNALKYSPDRTPIEISASADDLAAYYAVTDHGAGIAPEDLARVFERYVRTADDESTTGWGVGLYVCRKIVLAHGGDIWAERDSGGGASFVFTVPTWEAAS
jgi:signal transduction histidine kinase